MMTLYRMDNTVICLENLTKFYGRNRGIIDVNLEVTAGKIFGYLGPNGAGKTTTIRILLDFIRPDRGRALIFGRDSRKFSRDLHQRMGFLPGELFLYENLTCSEFLRFFARLRSDVHWPYVVELADRFDCHLAQPIRSLSQGNKRKVGLIQAFMHRPELIILDEPSIGFDPLIQHELYLLISECRSQGQTIFLSSHNLPEVERICDRVGIIRKGRLVIVEEVADLRSRSLRQVEIHFAQDVNPTAFSRLASVEIQSFENRVLHCRVKGGMDELVKESARFAILDFISREPSLEEVFLTYYGEDGDES